MRDTVSDINAAPDAVPGQLVTWSQYQGSAFFRGWLAWIGAQRIGRVDYDGEWFCSLPSEDERIDGSSADVEDAKAALAAFAEKWVATAGLQMGDDGSKSI